MPLVLAEMPSHKKAPMAKADGDVVLYPLQRQRRRGQVTNGSRAGWRGFSMATALVLPAVLSTVASAQQTGSAVSNKPVGPAGFYLTPSVRVSERYDDNIFGIQQNPPPTLEPSATPGEPPVLVPGRKKQGDFIFNATPGLIGGYDSAPFSLLAGYSLGADVYAENSSQDSFPSNQTAALTARYHPNLLLEINAAGGYNQSQNPGELNSATVTNINGLTPTGIQNGRSRSVTYFAGSSASYKLSDLNDLRGSYNFNHLDQTGAPTQDQHTVDGTFSHRFTPLDVGDLGYVYRHFSSSFRSQPLPELPSELTPSGSITVVNTPSEIDSNAVTVGWSHRFSELTQIVLRGGPRFTGSHIDPEAFASIIHSFARGEFDFTYVNGQTSAVGTTGALNVQSYTANFNYNLTQLWAARVTGGYSTSDSSEGSSGTTDVVLAALESRYQLFERLWVVLGYNFSYQKGVFSTIETSTSDTTIHNNNSKIYRNIVSIGLEVSQPFRVH
jgi:hypothetical protein